MRIKKQKRKVFSTIFAPRLRFQMNRLSPTCWAPYDEVWSPGGVLQRQQVKKEFLKMSLVQKGDFSKAWGQDPWAGRAALGL